MKIKVDINSVTKYFESMLDRAKLVDGWLNRVAYRELLRVQKERWASEGSSEGVPWAPIQSRTRQYKLKRYRDYPGAGRKALIATGRLAFSMTLDGSLKSDKAQQQDHYKMVSGQRLEMGSFVPYARYMEENGRDVTSLSKETVKGLADNLRNYLFTGTFGSVTR